MTLDQVLARAARLFPRHPATICGDHTQNYGELRRRVDRLASALRQLGVQRGERVGLLMLNCHRYLETVFACFEIGAVIVPLNMKLAPEELAFIINDTGCVALITNDGLQPLATTLRPSLPGVQHFIAANCFEDFHNYEELIEQSVAHQTSAESNEHDLTAIFYTSGTTGRPKGLMHSHRNLWMNALHCISTLGIGPDEIHLHGTPIFHLSNFPAVLTTTVVGGTHVLLKDFDPEAFLSAIERNRVTTILMIPIMLDFLLKHPAITQHDLSSLKRVFYGTTPMPIELLKQAIKILPNCAFIHGYGQSEACGVLTVLPFEDHVTDGPEHLVRRLGSLGREMIGVEVQVFDEQDRPVRPGEVGEIVTRNPSIMLGYWNQPEETIRVLRDGWLHTGDLATVDADNYIFLVDRKSDVIIADGEKIYTPEIESVLYAHPAVSEAAVIGAHDAKLGEAVKAVVTLKPGSNITSEELVAHCAAQLSEHKVPKTIEIIEGQLPRGWGGKVLKNVLREQHGVAATGA